MVWGYATQKENTHMARKTNPPVVYAKANRSLGFNGQVYALQEGQAWDGSDPVVLAHPDAFDVVPPDRVVQHSVPRRSGGVEQATAAPGERRNR